MELIYRWFCEVLRSRNEVRLRPKAVSRESTVDTNEVCKDVGTNNFIKTCKRCYKAANLARSP